MAFDAPYRLLVTAPSAPGIRPPVILDTGDPYRANAKLGSEARRNGASPSEEPKFFVSYARKDQEFALKLGQDLRAAGANLWVDQLDIRYGDKWDRAIQEALKTCDGMLVILSPDAVDSDNVMDEVNYALEKRKRVVPVIFRECEIPFRLDRLHHIDYAATDEEAGLTQVLAALGVSPQPTARPASSAPTGASPDSRLNAEDLPREQSVDGVVGAVHGVAAADVATLPPAQPLPVGDEKHGKHTVPAQPPSELGAYEAREVQPALAAEHVRRNEEAQPSGSWVRSKLCVSSSAKAYAISGILFAAGAGARAALASAYPLTRRR